MKKIAFNFFEEGQEIYFNVERLMQFEGLAKRPIGSVITQNALDMTALTILVSVGLRQYGNKTPQYYAKELQRLLDEGVDIQEIQEAVIMALAGAGVLGKAGKMAFFPEEFTDKEKQAIEEEAKN